MKKKVSFLISLIALLIIIAVPSAAETKALLYEDFESYTGGMPDGWDKLSASVCSVANFGDDHGNCLAIKSSESATLTARYCFDKTYTGENIYYISLYTRCDLPEDVVVLNLLDEADYPYRTIKVGEDVQIYTGDGSASFTQVMSDEYKADVWYRFDIWLDMEDDEISYIMTDRYGKIYDFATVCSGFDTFKAISISQMSKQNTVYYDDIRVEPATRSNIEKWLEEGVKVPDHIVNEFEVTIGSGNMGNIFFDDEEALLWTDISN